MTTVFFKSAWFSSGSKNVGALPQTSSFEPGMASARSIETRARVVSRAFASRAISSSAMKQTA